MKKREFPASYPLLGLLSLGPQTGYDLRKTAEATLGAFWHEGFAQVYASLDYFEAQGLARVAEAEPGPRRRRVYALTPEGDRVFQDWLERPVEAHDLRRHELLVKVFFGRRLAPDVLGGHLAAYEAAQGAWRRGLEALAARLGDENIGNPDLAFWLATVEHGACLGRALEAWSQRTAAALGLKDSLLLSPEAPPGGTTAGSGPATG